jgi:hypothetical protein
MNEYDAFVDWCSANGHDPHEEDFFAWREWMAQRTDDESTDRQIDLAIYGPEYC